MDRRADPAVAASKPAYNNPSPQKESAQEPIRIPEIETMAAISKDPILLIIFDEIKNFVRNKDIATYLRLNFTRLTAIRDLKESDMAIGDLLLALQSLELDTTKSTLNVTDGLAQKASKAGRAMVKKYPKLATRAAYVLMQLIRRSRVRIPVVYRQTRVDDLCAVWYAIRSDRYYQANEIVDPCIEYGFRILVVTHLYLVGGTPSDYKVLQRPKHMRYQQFLDLLPDFLSVARCKQAARLGSSIKTPITGRWKYQFASSLCALQPGCWKDLGEAEYEAIKDDSKQVVFLIHADDKDMPLRIAAKVQSRPTYWNTWSGSVTHITTREGPVAMPSPNFLPGPPGWCCHSPCPRSHHRWASC